MQKDEPLVSVVVIGFNQQDFVPHAINSVLAQSHANLECIFVDDGSRDSTVERATAIGRTDKRLVVYSKQNGGPSSARNYGAARISPASQYIAFVDGDDMLNPDFIQICLHYLRQNPSVGVVIPSYDRVDVSGALVAGSRSGHRWAPAAFWLWPRRLADSEHLTPFTSFYSGYRVPFWLARIEEYRKTEGWDEAFWFVEDADMVCQLAMVTIAHKIPQRLVRYRVHPQQATQGGAIAMGRAPPTLSQVQEKWNKRHFSDLERNRVLDLACIYFRVVHLPFRALWVAARTFEELVRAPSLKTLKWFLVLLCFFIRDFIYFKLFFWRATRRYVSTRFYEAH